MARYKIDRSDNGLTIHMTEAGPGGDRLVAAFQECQEGRCDCPTDEYEKVSTLSVESEGDDVITVRLVPKTPPGCHPETTDADRAVEGRIAFWRGVEVR